MSVESFDPGAAAAAFDAALADQLLSLVQDCHLAEELTVQADQAAAFASLAAHNGWAAHMRTLSDDQLKDLICVFTLGEAQFPAWQAGDKSPVIIAVRELKDRGTYPVELTRWIKSHTDNRFLPHGNLMDRL